VTGHVSVDVSRVNAVDDQIYSGGVVVKGSLLDLSQGANSNLRHYIAAVGVSKLKVVSSLRCPE
jgi:hypothetical protein